MGNADEFADPARAMTEQKIAELGQDPLRQVRVGEEGCPNSYQACAGCKKLDAVLRACDAAHAREAVTGWPQ